MTKIDIILKELEELNDFLKCNICQKNCDKPVRIKTCNHYFCSNCLKKKSNRLCPKCKTCYDTKEVDYNNIARETESIFLNLQEYLLVPESSELVPISNKDADNDVTKTSSENEETEAISTATYTFEYNNQRYHINYIDHLYSKVNAKGETPLHLACKRKKLEEVKLLIAKGVDLNVKDFAGWVPLHEAIESGYVPVIEILLQSGALLNVPGGEYVTPLHKAVMSENQDLVKLLLKYGANTDSLDYFGKKPVECTLNEDIIKTLNETFKCPFRTNEIFCKKKICVCLYYVDDNYKKKLARSKLVKVQKEFDSNVSHLIIKKSHKVSCKILSAMLEGCFILPQEWIDDFLENRYFVPIPSYIFVLNNELNSGIRKALLNSMFKLPRLFDGITFFIYGHMRPVEIYKVKFSKESISSMIQCGNGKVLHRAPTPSTCDKLMNFPYHSNNNLSKSRCCHYIIYEENNPPKLQYQMAEIKHKSSRWLIDCIINFTISY